jgi:aspartyl-tRNA(Asn)/glutamyl-tRNA(Gln) amidotransferase subunit A
MTRTVEDAALMLTVLSKPDARDWFALPYEARDYRIGLHEGIEGLRIAYSPALGYADVDPEIAELVKAAVPVFEELGAVVEAVDPGFEDPLHVFAAIWFSGAAKLLANLDEQQRAKMDPGLVEIANAGAKYTLAHYLDANAARVALGQTMRRFHERYDLLLTPSLPLPAFEAGVELPRQMTEGRWSHWTPFTFPFNLSGQPAASVPCGFTKDGLPAGLQLVGPMHDDALVLRAARAFESARPWPMPDAPINPAG